MSAIVFDTQRCAAQLSDAGVPPRQAQRHAEVMAETFIHYADKIVTKDYLDSRLSEQNAHIDKRFVEQNASVDGLFSKQTICIEKRFGEQQNYIDKRFSDFEIALESRFSGIDLRFERIDARLNQLFWMMGLGFTVLIIPQLQTWFG